MFSMKVGGYNVFSVKVGSILFSLKVGGMLCSL